MTRPVLGVEDMAFSYARDRPALQIDAFRLNRGECVALLGENGSGKTTLLRLLAGLCKPQRGTIRLLGRDITRLSPAQRSTQIAYLPQNPDALLSRNTVAAEMAAALKPTQERSAATGAHLWLEQVGLAERAEAHPLTLASGERYRLALATLLARSPALLLLDEPCSVLDRAETALLCRLIAAHCAAGNAVLLVTHDLEYLAAQGVICRTLQLADHELSEVAHAADIYFAQRRPCEYTILDRIDPC